MRIITIILTALFATNAYALEVDREVMPQILLGGRAMATTDAGYNFDTDKETGKINTSDSSLLLGFDKRTYDEGVAGANFGITDVEDGREVRINHLNVFYWNRDVGVHIGRGRLINTIVELPLIRDDDFLDYSHIGNASSSEEFDQIFGKNIKLDWFVDRKNQQVSAWVSTRNNDDEHAGGPGEADTLGIGYFYEPTENLAYVKFLRHAGVLIERQKLWDEDNELTSTYAAVGALEINLNERPDKNWSLMTQGIFNVGIAHAETLDTRAERAQAEYYSLVASLRYTARPKLLTRWQAALSAGYKDFSHVEHATQWSLAPSFYYRLGQGVDLLSQIVYTAYEKSLNNGQDEVLVQLGMSFNFDTEVNKSVGARNSILNLEHSYIP